MCRLLSLLVLLIGFLTYSNAQEIDAEFDKNRDFSIYKSFSIAEGEIITPKDQRKIPDDKLHAWVQDAIASELKGKGLTHVDSTGDLKVTYIIGNVERSSFESNPNGGLGGGFVTRDVELSSFVIDMNDRQNFLVYRVNGVTSTSGPNASSSIKEVVSKGFKKFSTKPKKKK